MSQLIQTSRRLDRILVGCLGAKSFLRWCRMGNRLTIFFLYLICSAGSFAYAQEESSQDLDITLSPQVTVFFSIPRRVNLKAPAVKLSRRSIRDNIEIPLDRIRFLADEQIQEDLGLSEKSKSELAHVWKLLRRFENFDKWNFFSEVDQVKEKAQKNVEEFLEDLNAIDKKGLLHPSQLSRLDQIRLRFNCLGGDSQNTTAIPVEKVKKQLNLSREQVVAIQSVIENNLGSELELATQFDELKGILTEEQWGKFKSVFGSLEHQTVPYGFALAQCKDFLPFANSEAVNNASQSLDFDMQLCDVTLLTLSGRLACETAYLEGAEQVFAPFTWRRILDQILDGGMEWLELIDSQRDEISNLRQDETRENGGNYRYYYGMEALFEIKDLPAKDWTVARYENRNRALVGARAESDKLLGMRMKSILLSDQVDAIRLALAAQKIRELGPFSIMLNNVAEDFELTEKQKSQINELREVRLSRLKSIFEKIDSFALKELRPEQLAWVDRNLGEHCSLYPCIWLFVLD